MVKDEGGFVHLTQDQQHLIINELFVFLKVAVHVLLQLCTDLNKNNNKKTQKKTTQHDLCVKGNKHTFKWSLLTS